MPDNRVTVSAARMRFAGCFDTASFAAFLQARAQRLAIALRIVALDARECQVVVTGQAGLLDAFEMACSLGPLDCLVRDVERCAVRL